MKIYISPVNSEFQPDYQDYIWPPQNAQPGEDRGVEQDFNEWILLQDDLLTDNPLEADFNYVPIFWNRRYINVADEDGHWGGGMDELNEEFERCKIEGLRTFIISEAGPKVVIPEINWEDTIIFTASRRVEGGEIDIPLLSGPHSFPGILPKKKYLASFSGNLSTDSIRLQMREELEDREDCLIENVANGEEYFVNVLLQSYISLCPRGQGAQSFRFWEAMQLGIVPLYISDMDCRPFKKWIDWNRCSFWREDVKDLSKYLTNLELRYGEDLCIKGQNAQYMYDHFLSYGHWCEFVIKELEGL